MGSIGIRRNGRDPVDLVLEEVGRGNVLAFAALPASNRRTEVFLAYKSESAGVIGGVVLADLDGPYVNIKVMDETAGPYTENRCPYMIMALLNPVPPGGHAAAWRARQTP